MDEILTVCEGNVQEWSVKVSNRLDHCLRSYDNLKSTKNLSLIFTRPTDTPPRAVKC